MYFRSFTEILIQIKNLASICPAFILNILQVNSERSWRNGHLEMPWILFCGILYYHDSKEINRFDLVAV